MVAVGTEEREEYGIELRSGSPIQHNEGFPALLSRVGEMSAVRTKRVVEASSA
jgi:hypothetical protein